MPTARDGASEVVTPSSTSTRRGQHNPPVELPSSTAKDFFEEAKVGKDDEIELQRKFSKFCTKATGSDGEEHLYLTFDDFCRLLQYYDTAPAVHFEAYFYAMDRDRDDKLYFREFYFGCCAADPQTVHILNSYTGRERAQYIFDFYDINRSGALEFEEFERIVNHCSPSALDAQADDLGLLQDGAIFVPPKSKQFYSFIQGERLRGTSRLFRIGKSLIKPSRSSHGRRTTQGGGAAPGAPTSQNRLLGALEDASTEEPSSDLEDSEWHAHLLDLDSQF
ncbi:unnamed protein product, partial [Polarella glacialis]